MSTGMPELGSKISLISKADIRYEGRLFTVDPQECTIALAGVRSFGTEDRDAKFPVGPQNQIYDYILFRGTDIKDIRVVNSNVIPNDPAIMSMQPTMGPQGFQQPAANFAHPGMVPGHIPGQIGQLQFGPNNFGGPSGLGPIGGGIPNQMSGGAPGMQLPGRGGVGLQGPSQQEISSNTSNSILSPGAHNNLDQRVNNDDASVLDLISGAGSRSTTPVSNLSRKSPTNDAGVQVNSHSKTVGSNFQNQVNRNVQHDDYRNRGNQRSGQMLYQPRLGGQQQSGGSGRREQNQRQNYSYNYNQQQQRPQQQRSNSLSRTQMQQRNQMWGIQGPRQQMNRMSRGPQRRMPIGQLGYNRRNNSGGRVGGGQANKPGSGPNKLKFDSEFDFESANTEFEELRSKLSDLKLDGKSNASVSKSATTSTAANGVSNLELGSTNSPLVDGEAEKKDDSGNETGAGAGENEVDDDSEVFYDKNKSFFDNISCEAVERSKGRSQRTDWRTERKLNSETFGVASARRAGKGRQGYYNRMVNDSYRQGGGYRNNYRNNNNQRQHQQQQQHQQQRRVATQQQQKSNSSTTTSQSNNAVASTDNNAMEAAVTSATTTTSVAQSVSS